MAFGSKKFRVITSKGNLNTSVQREEVQDDEKETLKMNQRFLSHTKDSARLQKNPPTSKREDSTKRTFLFFVFCFWFFGFFKTGSFCSFGAKDFLCRELRDPSSDLEVPVH